MPYDEVVVVSIDELFGADEAEADYLQWIEEMERRFDEAREEEVLREMEKKQKKKLYVLGGE